jgi:hypothetical protein
VRRFKIKDLMINIMPEAGPGQGDCFCTIGPCSDAGCTGPCSVGCTPAASLTQQTCQGCIPFLGTPIFETPFLGTPVFATPATFGIAGQLQELTLLKAQLKRALQQIDAQERSAQAQMEPKSLEEVEILETKLSEALDEVRARKAELEKKPPRK